MKRTQPLGLLLLLVFATSLFAGLDTPATYDNEVRPARNVQQLSYDTDSRETAAVLTWLADQNPNTNFGGWTNAYFFEYYVPAADGYISSIDFNFSDLPQVTGGGMSIWIFNIAYDWEEIATDEIADGCGNSHLGYYDEAWAGSTPLKAPILNLPMIRWMARPGRLLVPPVSPSNPMPTIQRSSMLILSS